MVNILRKAIDYAKMSHDGQLRKGNKEAYINHCGRVAMRIMIADPDESEDVIAAAWLHDTIEDTNVSYDNLYSEFGRVIAGLVLGMTNPSHDEEHSHKPRTVRKAIDRQYISAQSREVRLIKLADRIDNLTDFYNANDGFMYKYAAESQLLLDEALRGAHWTLEQELQELINKINGD